MLSFFKITLLFYSAVRESSLHERREHVPEDVVRMLLAEPLSREQLPAAQLCM